MSTISSDLLPMIILAMVMAPAGGVFLWLGWRRRAGVAPHCAVCDYSLVGRAQDSDRCPECGADLTRDGAIASGRRRRDSALLAAGLVMLLPAMGVGGLYAYRTFGPSNRPRIVAVPGLKPLRPMAVPVPAPASRPIGSHEGLSDEELVAAILSAEQPSPDELGALLSEAERRVKANLREGVRKPWVSRLVDSGLKRQADTTRDWPVPWAAFVESLRSTDHLPHDKWRQYLQQGVRIEARFRRQVEVGAAVPLTYKTTVRLSPALAQQIRIRPMSVTLGELTTDEPLRNDPITPDRFNTVRPRTWGFGRTWPESMGPGQHVARFTVLVVYSNAPAVNSTSDWIVRLDQPVTVVPKTPRKSHEYTPGMDEAFARSLRLSADPNSPLSDGLRWDGRELSLTLTCVNSPVDANAQLSVGIDKGGLLVGAVRWKKGESGTRKFKVSSDFMKRAAGRPVDVILSGMHSRGVDDVDDEFTWNGTVRFDRVLIVDETAATRPSAEQLAATELQIHRPGTTVRPYGYYPVTRPTTAPATWPAR